VQSRLIYCAIATKTRRSIRNNELTLPASAIKRSAPSTINDDDSDFPPVSMLNQSLSAKKVNAGKSRDSLSSVSTSLDYDEGSGYSTPGTSAFATPNPQTKPTPGRRGRPAASMVNTSSGISLVAKAAALRNSKLSLGNKRKRVPDSDEDDADEDNTPDAQLARALQKQEDAAASGMNSMDIDGPSTSIVSVRPPRKVQKILPKADYALSDDDKAEPLAMTTSPHFVKKPIIELSSFG
jgi:DNA repair protein RAD16